MNLCGAKLYTAGQKFKVYIVIEEMQSNVIKSMLSRMRGRMLPGPSDEFIGETKSFLSCFVCWDVVYVPRNSNFFWLIILRSGLGSVHCKPGGLFSISTLPPCLLGLSTRKKEE